ncbi:MAG: molybdate ABC transporter permease subunit, partial [Mycobacterium sp.]
MTTAVTTGPDVESVPVPGNARGDGISLRVGVAVVWLSVIVLLP